MKNTLTNLGIFTRKLNRYRLLSAAAAGLAIFPVTLLAVSAYNTFLSPIQEGSAFSIFIALSALSIISSATLIFLVFRHARLTIHHVAKRIETSFPELNDILITATDIKSRGTNYSLLETFVLEEASSKIDSFDWQKKTTRFYEKRGTQLVIWFILGLLTGFALKTTATQKAASYGHDLWHGSFSGMSFDPVSAEIPRNTDFNLQIEIHRWENEAKIEYKSEGIAQVEPVVIDVNGKGSFTFFAVTETTQYRVISPSLSSPWQTVQVYDPPVLESTSITLNPPSYTRLPTETLDGLADLEVLENTRVQFNTKTRGTKEAFVITTEETVPLENAGNDSFRGALFPAKSTSYRLELRSEDGRVHESPEFKIKVNPDLPPVVEIIAPTRDSNLAPDEALVIAIYAADDYGLTFGQIKASISGQPIEPVPLSFEPEPNLDPDKKPMPLLEAEFQNAINLADIDAKDGDVISLYVEVIDNRKPLSNRSRTDLLFVEVREPKPPVEMNGMPMDQKQLDLRALIAEQKRLIRESHRSLDYSGARKKDELSRIAADIGSLAAEIKKTYLEIEKDLLEANRQDIATLFQDAIALNQKAIAEINKSQVAESIPLQSSALSNLVKLENIFRQNIISKDPSESDSESDSKGQSGKSKKPSEEGSDSEQPSATEQLKEAQAELRELIDGQNSLNRQFERANQTSWLEQEAQQASDEQGELSNRSSQLASKLRMVAGSEEIQAQLGEASRQMDSAGEASQEQEAGSALRSGLRAREALRAAAASLESAIANATTQEVQSAAEAAAQLAAQQADAAEKSGAAGNNPSPESLAGMESEQRDLNKAFNEFLNDLNQRANELADSDPQVSDALREAGKNAANRRTASDMERAANALLYGQTGNASKLQSQAASDIGQLAKELSESRSEIAEDAGRQAGKMARELNSALEELASYARNPEIAPENRLDEMKDDWTEKLKQLEKLTNNQQAGRLGKAMAGLKPSDFNGQLADTRAILQEASRILQNFLEQADTNSSLQMNRQAAPPPDRYRRQVEEYFRRLANEPDPAQ